MKRAGMLLFLVLATTWLNAQGVDSLKSDDWKTIYRGAVVKINDLQHTKLEVRFDYNRSYLYGKAWLTLRPHFYPTDTLTLDAKGMDIHEVALSKTDRKSKLKYRYDGQLLFITLDRTYKKNESYTVYIDYTAKPNEYKQHGSEAISDAKGLYFINPLGQEKNKPIQIWTQGETEATSVWCPTLDHPNQKSTQDFSLTVDPKYVTLSNGRLVSQKKNTDGTRTDNWKMDQPNATYLFFMGVGDYAVIKDSYKGKEVSYYVEKEYAPVARRIFGNTPEMIGFYSSILGYDYPWNKYAQMTARDYVSGAMENTTATLHTDALQQDARQLADGNAYEDYVAHELFHQWFGDLVTTESWSNLTLNESFADFSETLWNEHKYGKDAGDAVGYQDILKYLDDPTNPSKDLVRYHYADKEDMFDMVTYSKGARILNMLRYYVGDSAFFKSLNLYLKTYQYGNAEADNLRMAFEEVTGQDLHWYWKQWYYGSGHPKFNIDYIYDDAAKNAQVIVNQTQATGKVFRMPVAIDLYFGNKKERHQVWVENRSDTFRFTYSQRPDLINFDGDKILLCEKTDNKTLDNFIFQYKYAGKYVDRREAIDYCANKQDDPKALDLLKLALKDPFHDLRSYTIIKLDLKKPEVKAYFESTLTDMADHDPKPTVQANAIGALTYYENPKFRDIFAKHIHDSSYSVAGNALEGLILTDPDNAYEEAKKMINAPARGELMTALTYVMIRNNDQDAYYKVLDYFKGLSAKSPLKTDLLQPICVYIAQTANTEKVKAGIDVVINMREDLKSDADATTVINNMIKEILDRKEKLKGTGANDNDIQAQLDYIHSKAGN